MRRRSALRDGAREDRPPPPSNGIRRDAGEPHPKLMELTGEGDPLAVEQPTHDGERLLVARVTPICWVTERLVFRIVPTSPDPQDQSSAAHFVERRRHLREEARVPETPTHHHGAQEDPSRDGRHGRQDRPGLVHGLDASVISTVEEVIEHPHGIEASRLRGEREGTYVAPRWGDAPHLFGGREINADLHGVECKDQRRALPGSTS